MSSSFSNKHTNGKFNRRYYYYRCTSTTKFDWQSCSVRQVSAERLENFCLENLERILVDKSYVENLVFRLNYDLEAGYRVGHELTDSCSKFSTESISNTLKFFLSSLKTTKGIERNLFSKRFLSNIFYSPESIKIRFISCPDGGEAAAKASPAPPSAGLGEQTPSSENSRFALSNYAGSSRIIREEHPELEEFLWGDSFWADGYFVSTHSVVSESTIRNYIKAQDQDR